MRRTEMNKLEEDRYNWIKGIDTNLTKLMRKVDDLNLHTVPREYFDALLEYLKLDMRRVEAHIEFISKEE